MTRLAFDPHVHSAASYDGTAPVEAVLDRARAAGLDAVAVTDHDTLAGSRRAVALAPGYGLLAVPGVEVSTADGHLLALGIGACPPPGRPLAETVRTVRRAGGLAVVPHPFQRLRHGVSARTLRSLPADARPDAIETYNACALSNVRNRQAERFAAARGYPAVGGSDAHTAGTVGRAHATVEVDADAPATTDPTDCTVPALLDAVRAGRTAVRGRLTPLTRYVRKYATNARLKVSAGSRGARG